MTPEDHIIQPLIATVAWIIALSVSSCLVSDTVMTVKGLGLYSAAEDTLHQGQHYISVVPLKLPVIKVTTMRKANQLSSRAVRVDRPCRGTKRFLHRFLWKALSKPADLTQCWTVSTPLSRLILGKMVDSSFAGNSSCGRLEFTMDWGCFQMTTSHCEQCWKWNTIVILTAVHHREISLLLRIVS